MRCRAIRDGNVAMFGSVGLKPDGTSIQAIGNQQSYDIFQLGICSDLVQRLSVLKGELWYSAEYGLPITDKVKAKMMLDMYVADTVMAHPDVIDVKNLTSSTDKGRYSCTMTVETIYGDLTMTV